MPPTQVKHARETLKFLQQLVKAAQAPGVEVALDEAELRATLGELLQAKLCAVSPPIRTVTVQVLRAVGGDVPKPSSGKAQGKRKADEAPDEVDPIVSSKPDKKAKKSKSKSVGKAKR